MDEGSTPTARPASGLGPAPGEDKASGQERAGPEWLAAQVTAYRDVRPVFERYAACLEQVLRLAASRLAPMAIVEARAKTVASFAEKCQRKWPKHKDPVNQLTDLCGVRVITHTSSEVEAVCRFIEAHFRVDRENSLDVRSRLRPTEFGYRSVHYVVQLEPGRLPCREVQVKIPDELYPGPGSPNPLKAEIQVRTLLEHAWAAFSHERVYKGPFDIPAPHERELSALAAMLEEADQSFSRIQADLQTYGASYEAYRCPEDLLKEMERLEIVVGLPGQEGVNAADVRLAHRLGRVAMSLEMWQRAILAMKPYARFGYQPLVRDLGVALCRLHQPGSEEYAEGQLWLETASAPEYADPDALCSLGGSYRRQGLLQKARDCYRKAYEIDPTFPYALGNYAVTLVRLSGSLDAVRLLRPSLEKAARRCEEQVRARLNLPWAAFDRGMFLLLLAKACEDTPGRERDTVYESLMAFAQAVQLSQARWMIETSLKTLEQLEGVRDSLKGYEWIRRLLLVGMVAKFGDDAALAEIRSLATPHVDPIRGPVAIVVGGTDPSVQQAMERYQALLDEAFRGFRGTIISGGTTAGIAGLVGGLRGPAHAGLHKLGYVPGTLPAGAELHQGYSELRKTGGTQFSALETVQYWIDLLASGIAPKDVRVLGINGGQISAAEFRLALALGARVAVVEGSGRQAAKLLEDPAWNHAEGLVQLPVDGSVAAAFANPALPCARPAERQGVAHAAHRAHRELERRLLPEADKALGDWGKLPQEHREPRLRLADHLLDRLPQLGYQVVPQAEADAAAVLSGPEVEALARTEHGWWVAEQLLAGWAFGEEESAAKKVSRYLVAWERLAPQVQQWTCQFVAALPGELARLGLGLRRVEN